MVKTFPKWKKYERFHTYVSTFMYFVCVFCDWRSPVKFSDAMIFMRGWH